MLLKKVGDLRYYTRQKRDPRGVRLLYRRATRKINTCYWDGVKQASLTATAIGVATSVIDQSSICHQQMSLDRNSSGSLVYHPSIKACPWLMQGQTFPIGPTLYWLIASEASKSRMLCLDHYCRPGLLFPP